MFVSHTDRSLRVANRSRANGGDHNVDDGSGETASKTEDQQSQHTAKLQELLSMDKFGVVEVLNKQTAITTSPLDPLGPKTTAGWFLHDANCDKSL